MVNFFFLMFGLICYCITWLFGTLLFIGLLPISLPIYLCYKANKEKVDKILDNSPPMCYNVNVKNK